MPQDESEGAPWWFGAIPHLRCASGLVIIWSNSLLTAQLNAAIVGTYAET